MSKQFGHRVIAAAAYRSHAGHILNEIEAATDFELSVSCEPHFMRVCEGKATPGEEQAATVSIGLESTIASVDQNCPAVVARQLREWAAKLEQMARAVETVTPESGFTPKCYLVTDSESGRVCSTHFFREPALDAVTALRESQGKACYITSEKLSDHPGVEAEMLRMVMGIRLAAMETAAASN